MSEIQNSGVSRLQHLQSLQSQSKSKSKASNMIQVDDLVGVYLGAEPTEHFSDFLESNLSLKALEPQGHTQFH